jgi:hypothetical protein
MAETLDRLDRLNAELNDTESRAEPLRRLLQSGDPHSRDKALEMMRRIGISESDLCTAWHHLPEDRRAELREMFRTLRIA